MRTPVTAPANPGASSTAIVYDADLDDTPGAARKYGPTRKNRLILAYFTNVADSTIVVEWSAVFGGTLRNVATVAVAANTFTERDILLMPGRTKVSIVTVTGPTTFEVAADVVDDRALAQ